MRVILGAGAVAFAVSRIAKTAGIFLDEADRTPETIAERRAEIADPAAAKPFRDAYSQTHKFVAAAKAKAKGA